MRVLSIIYILLFSLSSLYGQYQIETLSDLNIKKSLFRFEIQNLSTAEKNVSFIIECSLNGRPTYQAQTRAVSLNPGINQFSHDLLQPIQVNLDDLISVPVGEKVIYEVKLIQNNTIIARERKKITLNLTNNEKNDEGNSTGNLISDNLSLNGNINILGQLSDSQGIGSQVPQNYLRSNGNATFAFSDLPIDFGYFVSTEQSPLRQSMNRATLKLNVQQLKQNLRKRVDEKIKNGDSEVPAPTDVELIEFKSSMVENKYPDYQLYSNYFETELGQNDWDAIKIIKSIEKLESAASTKSNLKKFKKLVKDNTESRERKDLHLFVLELVRQSKSKKALIRSLSKDRKEIERQYDYVETAELYFASLDVSDYKRKNASFNPYHFLNKTQKMLDMFQGISIGTTSPYFSRMTLSGLLVNGVSVELTPGKFYFSGVVGRSARETFNTRFTLPDLTLKQNTYGVKFGYGNIDDTHLHMSIVNITDANSDSSLNLDQTPESNRIIGFEGGVSLLDNKLNLSAEWAGSMISRDKNADLLSDADPKSIPLSFLYPSLKSTSFFDQAYSLNGQYSMDQFGLDLTGTLERINPEFHSLGSPTLIANVSRWDLGARKSLLDNKVLLGLRAQRINNSLDPLLSPINNTTESYGGDVTIAFPSLPQIFASYAPFAQNSLIRETGEEQFSDAIITNVNVSYPYSLLDGVSANTSLSYFKQDLISNIDNANSTNTTYGLNQAINYNKLGLTVGYTLSPNQQFADAVQSLSTINANANYSADRLNISLGVQHMSIENVENKIGYQLTSSYKINDYLIFELRGLKNIYDHDLNGASFNENIVQSGIRINFGGEKKSGPETATPLKDSPEIIREEISTSVDQSLDSEIEPERIESETIEPEVVETPSIENELITELPIETEEKPSLEEDKSDTVIKESIPPNDNSEGLVLRSTSEKDHYKILLTIRSNPNKSFMSLMDLGPTIVEPAGNQYAYYLGFFNTEEKAQKKLKQVQRRGYPSATIIRFNEGEILEEITQDIAEEKEIEENIIEEVEKEAVKQIQEVIVKDVITYHILFRVLDNPNEEFPVLEKIGPLYRETFDDNGTSRYLIGSSENLKEAQLLKVKVVKAGFGAASIAKYRNGRLQNIVE